MLMASFAIIDAQVDTKIEDETIPNVSGAAA